MYRFWDFALRWVYHMSVAQLTGHFRRTDVLNLLGFGPGLKYWMVFVILYCLKERIRINVLDTIVV